MSVIIILILSKCPQNSVRRAGRLRNSRVEGREGIVDGTQNRAHCARRSSLARALGSEFRCRGRCFDMVDLDIRHLGGHGNEIIGESTILELALCTIDTFLEQYAAQSLHDATSDLFLHHQRVQQSSRIMHHPMAQ